MISSFSSSSTFKFAPGYTDKGLLSEHDSHLITHIHLIFNEIDPRRLRSNIQFLYSIQNRLSDIRDRDTYRTVVTKGGIELLPTSALATRAQSAHMGRETLFIDNFYHASSLFKILTKEALPQTTEVEGIQLVWDRIVSTLLSWLSTTVAPLNLAPCFPRLIIYSIDYGRYLIRG